MSHQVRKNGSFQPDDQPGEQRVAPPSHLDFLAQVLADHVVLAGGTFGDESARGQIVQALRIAGNDRRFVTAVNMILKQKKARFYLEVAGNFLALMVSTSPVPIDTVSLSVVEARKPQRPLPRPEPTGNIGSKRVQEQQWWDHNFR